MPKAATRKTGEPVDSPDPDVFHAVVRAKERAALDRAVRELDLDVDHQPVEKEPDGGVSVTAFVTARQIGELKRAGYELRVGENLSAVGRERQKEVGKGDRFEGGKVPPRGLGRKVKEVR